MASQRKNIEALGGARKRKLMRGSVVKLPTGRRGIVVKAARGPGATATVCTIREGREGRFYNIHRASVGTLTPVGYVQRMPRACDDEAGRGLAGARRRRKRRRSSLGSYRVPGRQP